MTQLTNRGRFLCIPDGSSQTVSSDSSPLQSSGNSVSDAPNQYGFFLAQRRNLLFENMQLMYAARPFYWNGWRGSRSFRRAPRRELNHRPGVRETDAKGLIVKNIAGRLERTACDGMRKPVAFRAGMPPAPSSKQCIFIELRGARVLMFGLVRQRPRMRRQIS